MMENVEQISATDFQSVINHYIHWASTWDGALPADVFFGVWADLQQPKKSVELKARIVQGELKILPPLEGAIRVIDNAIVLEDGRELVIQLEPAA
jgi:hypothetical protein